MQKYQIHKLIKYESRQEIPGLLKPGHGTEGVVGTALSFRPHTVFTQGGGHQPPKKPSVRLGQIKLLEPGHKTVAVVSTSISLRPHIVCTRGQTNSQ